MSNKTLGRGTNSYQRVLWGFLAIAGGVYASYRIWSDKSRALEQVSGELEVERTKNTRPILRGSIDQIHVVAYEDADLTRTKMCDVQLYVQAVIYNDSDCQATIRTFGLTVEDVAGIHTSEYLGEADKAYIQIKPGYQDSVGQVIGREIEHMADLGRETVSAPVLKGVHRVGWLRFKASEVDPSAVEQGTYWLSAIDSFGKHHQLCSCKHPPRGTGKLLRNLNG